MSARGEQRREALVVAAAALLGRDGPGALSARSVAGEAGVPLAAVSYYFDTVDDLVRTAAERLYDGYLRAARDLVDRAPAGLDDDGLARLVVRVWLDPTPAGPDPDRVRSLLTSLASAAQAPALAPRLRRYDRGASDLLAQVLRGAGRETGRVRVLLAALDGFALARLCGVSAGEGAGEDGAAEDGAGGDGAGEDGAADLRPGTLLDDLAGDLRLVLDDLAPTAPTGP
ncbi:TetR/AcrR family transcriptional regulator [Jannaschia sp. R86511]|uniref:TetR/AcrR family transcriptional regulator n=1 Tax=Jannaschia sp. R86511 TaxID=3093853 RepID=UPI0036D37125